MSHLNYVTDKQGTKKVLAKVLEYLIDDNFVFDKESGMNLSSRNAIYLWHEHVRRVCIQELQGQMGIQEKTAFELLCNHPIESIIQVTRKGEYKKRFKVKVNGVEIYVDGKLGLSRVPKWIINIENKF
jgi:hypothetical protein